MKLTKKLGIFAISSLLGCGGNTTTTCIPVSKEPIVIEQNIYLVQKDDNLTKIAKQKGVSLEDLILLNPQISNPDRIYPGQRLMIPQGKTNHINLKRTYPGFQSIYSIQDYDLDNLTNPKTFDIRWEEDTMLLARLVFGEARSENEEYKKAIAYTVLNRTGKHKWWGHTLNEVMLKPLQYSCFNKWDANYSKVTDPFNTEPQEVWKDCLSAALQVLKNPSQDTTNGATHYHTSEVNPDWAQGKQPIKVLQNSNGEQTLFYKLNN